MLRDNFINFILLISGVFILVFNFYEINSIQRPRYTTLVTAVKNKIFRKSEIIIDSTVKPPEKTTIDIEIKNIAKIVQTISSSCEIKAAPPNTFEFIPLLSYPGSGNTWLRHLIEISTGFQTTTVEKGDQSLAPFFIGEYDHPHSGSSIVQKTHWFNYIKYWFSEFNTFEDSEHCIFLLRRPVQAFLADFQKKLSKQICKKQQALLKSANNKNSRKSSTPSCQANHTFKITQHELQEKDLKMESVVKKLTFYKMIHF